MTQATSHTSAPAAPRATHAVALRNQPGRAIAYMLSQAFLLTLMDCLVRWLAIGGSGQIYSVGQIAFVRYALGLCMTVGFAWGTSEGIGSLRTRRPVGHLIRSGCNLFTMLAFYLALKLVPLPTAICLALASPIFVTILSIPMLKERVGLRRWSAVAVGFAGIVLIKQPTTKGIGLHSLLALFTDPAAAGPEWGAILALFSAAAWAATQVSSRQLSTSEPSHRILFYYSLIVVVVLGAAMPFYWITPGWHDALLFIAIGVMGTLGQFCLNQAFRYGQASLVAPLDYTGLIWAGLFGWVFWRDVLTPRMLVGAAIVAGSCIYINQRGAKKKRAAQP